MKDKALVEQLFRWRLAQAESEAPPAPSAARLLELARLGLAEESESVENDRANGFSIDSSANFE